MTTLTAAIASAGWIVACPACAQHIADNAGMTLASSVHEVDGSVDATSTPRFEDLHINAVGDDDQNPIPVAVTESARSSFNFRHGASSYSVSLGNHHALFGYIGLPGESALGPPAFSVSRFADAAKLSLNSISHWLDPSASSPRTFTVGYLWRDLKLEGSAFSVRVPEKRLPVKNELLHLDNKSTRLSFIPSPNWTFQISRGSLTGLDQVVANGEARRTAISATYYREVTDGNWQTTLAWGRNARKAGEATIGYFLESILKLGGAHVMFGRVEQVGSDELLRGSDLKQRQIFKMNKLTFGYFHDVQSSAPFKIDAGWLVSRNFLPSSAGSAYGADPVTYMMFIRLKMQ